MMPIPNEERKTAWEDSSRLSTPGLLSAGS